VWQGIYTLFGGKKGGGPTPSSVAQALLWRGDGDTGRVGHEREFQQRICVLLFFGGKRGHARRFQRAIFYAKLFLLNGMPNHEGDMLGRERANRGLPGRRLVESGGSVQAGQTTPCFDADFLPYGQEVDYTSTCGSNYKFIE
jgi:hypothetical protein